MELQKMPGKGLCLPTSFAMALGIPVASVMGRLSGGHYSIVFSDKREPFGWRGTHVQECIQIALSLGFAVTPLELYPVIAAHKGDETFVVVYPEGNERLFKDQILTSRGVLTGKREVPGVGIVAHAVAYDHGRIYDPNGVDYAYSLEACESVQFSPQCAWRIDRI